MNFEEELKRRIKNEIIENAKRDTKPINYEIILSNYINELIKLYEFYLTNIERKNDFDEISNLEEKLEDMFSSQNLMKHNNDNFSDKEEKQIMYSYLTYRWRNKLEAHSGNITKAEIIIMKIFLNELKELPKEKINIFIDMYEKSDLCSNEINYIKRIIDQTVYDGIGEKAEIILNQKTEQGFNNQINCGGYALKLSHPIFPNNQIGLDKSVSIILDTYPFVRLLGDTELRDDEYLVMYRKYENGHHFIRVEADGTIMEKNGSEPIKKFEEWSKYLEKSITVYFAVKKEHEMDIGTSTLDCEKSLDFEDTIKKSIIEKQNDFYYHGKKYGLRKNPEQDEDIYIISDNQIIGYMIDNEEGQLIEIDSKKMSYIINGGNVTNIKIKNIIKEDENGLEL